jgi:predicted secreted protein
MSKLLISPAILMILSLLLPLAWAGAPSGPRVITEKENGGTVTMKPGEKLVLNLRNPASGGYSRVSPLYDQRFLRLVTQKEMPPASGPTPKMGDFGRLDFEWEALNPGETEVVIKAARPWEKGQEPLSYFKIKVVVSP